MRLLGKRLMIIGAIALSFLSVCFCTKDYSPNEFSIIGPWGMVSGTITSGDGITTRYESLGLGSYYEYLEFEVDGTLIRTSLPDKEKEYGVYTYNDASKSLSYKFDGDKYYQPATINVISATEMNMTTDWGSVGIMTQYFIKVK